MCIYRQAISCQQATSPPTHSIMDSQHPTPTKSSPYSSPGSTHHPLSIPKTKFCPFNVLSSILPLCWQPPSPNIAFFRRLIPGFVANRIGRFNTLIVTIAACSILPFALWLQVHSSEPLLILFAILFGFWSACDTSLTPPCLGQLCRTEDYGRYYASAFAVCSFAVSHVLSLLPLFGAWYICWWVGWCGNRPLTSLPIAGALITASDRRDWGLIVFTGSNYAVAGLCFAAARVKAVGWNWKQKFWDLRILSFSHDLKLRTRRDS